MGQIIRFNSVTLYSSVCVLGVSILPLSTILLLNFRIGTVWYFCAFHFMPSTQKIINFLTFHFHIQSLKQFPDSRTIPRNWQCGQLKNDTLYLRRYTDSENPLVSSKSSFYNSFVIKRRVRRYQFQFSHCKLSIYI